MKTSTKNWIQYAERDLKACKLLISDESIPGLVIFHAQQAVEKLFKALIEESGERIPRSHDLEKLYFELSKTYKIELDEDLLALLSSFYIETRYPPSSGLLPSGLPFHVDAEKSLRFAEIMHQKINQIVPA